MSGPPRIHSLRDASDFTLSDEQESQLLNEQYECTLCWSNQEGHPIAVVQAFAYLDGAFFLAADESRARVRAVRRDPRVSIAISGMGTAVGRSRSVAYKGKVDAVIDDRRTILLVLAEIARKYDPDDTATQRAHVQAADHPGRVLLHVVPLRRTNSFDGSLARGPRNVAQ
jgi:nitroimidazol reductase NimA-like FMN-containing flavoprotein (pyridoxamine 5'-phosphate oxidase superfamily)